MPETYIANLGYKVNTSQLKRGEKDLDSLAMAGKRTEGSIAGVSSAVGILSTAIGALAASSAVTGVIKYSDAWNQVDNQLKIVITSETELIQKRQQLLDLSKDTNAELGSTVALYAELYRNTRELNTSDDELISVTKTLNNLFSAGAKDAQTQAGAIRQLSQALGTGALRGDEFISVTEAAPRVMDALAESLGIAKGELRDFAATGGITSEVLIDALSSYSEEAQRLADRTTKTFAQYQQNIESNVISYVGASESLLSATEILGSSLESVSENIDGVVNGMATASSIAGAYAVVMAGKATAATVSKSAANVALIKTEASVAAATLAATEAEVARLTISKQAHADTILRVKSEGIRDTVRKQLTLTTVQLTAAEGRLATAQTAAATTGARATASAIALTGATTTLGAAVNFLLGPWGLLLTAVSAAGVAYALTDSKASDYNDTLDTQKGLLEDVTKRVKLLSEFQKADVALNAQLNLNDNLEKQRKLEAQILADSFSSDSIASLTLKKQEQLTELKKEQARYESIILAAYEKPAEKEGKGQSKESLDYYKKEIAALDARSAKLSMSADDYEIYAARVNAASKQLTKTQSDEIAKRISDIQMEADALRNAYNYDSWVKSIYESVITQKEKITTEIDDIYMAMLGEDVDWDTGTKRIEQLQDELDAIKEAEFGNPFEDMTNGAISALTSMQSLSSQGSKEWKKLGVAIEAVNTIQAVNAVLNQASGDPYTAFARMAAMAASVASLGYGVGSITGGDDSADTYIQAQQEQGLNEWGEKANSIANSSDITASATEKLVGINTSMLKAITLLQDRILAASGMVAKGTSGITFNGGPDVLDYSDISGIFEPIGIEKILMDPLGLFGSTFNKIFGGDSKLVNQGIHIVGGSINDLIDEVMVYAFQDVSAKKNVFDDYDTYRSYVDISDEVGEGISLVFGSIVEAVGVGASMLGISEQEINDAIAAFEIETTDISTVGMTLDEQTEALNSYFSEVFNDLSLAVVPWLEDFQQAGEELGETLTRVATEVSILDVVVRDLGVSMSSKELDPEAYAEAADNIAMLTGGVEEFASKTSSFINNFATDATKIGIYQNSLTESLAEVGLTLPGTTDAMWDLMQSLDASTEEGQAQIATLLNVQETAAEYYSLIEKTTGAYRDAIDAMYDVSEAVSQMTLDAALAAARMGDFTLASELDLNTLAPDTDNYSTRAEYEIARAETAAKLEELAQLTEGSIPIDEQQLDTLKQIEENTKNQTDNTMQIAELNKQMSQMADVQKGQARNIADSNAIQDQSLRVLQEIADK